MRYWNNLVLVVLRNEQSADGQRDALAVGVDVDDLRLDLLALLQGVGSLLDTMVRDLGDVDQAVNAGHDLGRSRPA